MGTPFFQGVPINLHYHILVMDGCSYGKEKYPLSEVAILTSILTPKSLTRSGFLRTENDVEGFLRIEHQSWKKTYFHTPQSFWGDRFILTSGGL